MKDDKLAEEIKMSFENSSIPALDPANITKLQNYMDTKTTKIGDKRKSKGKARPIFIRLSVALFSFVLVLVPCLLVFLLNANETQFYGENEITQQAIGREDAIATLVAIDPRLSFVFDECACSFVYGYYQNETKKLVALNMNLDKYDVPFTNVKMDVILDKRYQYKFHETFLVNAEITENARYTLYQKSVVVDNYTQLWAAFLYDEYKLYLKLDCEDFDFFNKFL